MTQEILIHSIIRIAKQAGELLMEYYNKYNYNIDYKSDSSPVTCADIAANKFICEQIINLYPEIPIISEEDQNNPSIIPKPILNQTNEFQEEDAQCRLLDEHSRDPQNSFVSLKMGNGITNSSSRFWSIDPLDATKSFIEKNGEFTINIGLIEDSKPKHGVIYAPLSKKLYYTENNLAYKQFDQDQPQLIRARKVSEEGATILVSASSGNNKQLNQFLQTVLVKEIIPFSSALKICLIAEGLADIYPRFGDTMEWDTAAAHAILNAAGGSIKDLKGNHLTYGHSEKEYYNPYFIALGITK